MNPRSRLSLALALCLGACPSSEAGLDSGVDTGQAVDGVVVESIDGVPDATEAPAGDTSEVTEAADVGSGDTSPADTSPADTLPADTPSADTSATDTSATDTAPADASPSETSEPPASGLTSDDLIRQAEAGGAIDAETALLYRVYAQFDDARLPAPYRGDDAALDGLVMFEVADRFDGLSDATREQLAPFLMAPIYEGSWYHRRHLPPPPRNAAFEWNTVCQVRWHDNPVTGTSFEYHDGDKVRVWWQREQLDAQATADNEELASDILDLVELTILPAELGQLGRGPISDEPALCNGGDGRLDIYLLAYRDWAPEMAAARVAGFVQPMPLANPGRFDCAAPMPSVLVLNRDFLRWAWKGGSPRILPSVLAHEVTHVLQNTYRQRGKCPASTSWIKESTAVWMAELLFPESADPAPHLEHSFGYHYGADSHRSVDDPEAGAQAVYGFYLMPYWLTWGPPRAQDGVRRILETWEATDDPFKAFDTVLPGGWRESWHRFGLEVVNLEPHRFFEEADKFPYRPKWSGDASLELHGIQELEIAYPGETILMPYLSHRFFRFKFPHEEERSVVIRNTFAPLAEGDPDPDVLVTAMPRLADRTLPDEDWTHEEEPFICRSLPDERVSQLLIAASNREWEVRGPDALAVPETPFAVIASNIHCGKWTGIVTFRGEQTFSLNSDEGPITYHETIEYQANPTFAPVEELSPTLVQGFGTFLAALERTGLVPRYYVVESGELSYTHTVAVSGPGPSCTATATGGAQLASGLSFMTIMSIGAPGKRGGVFAVGTAEALLTETASCAGVTTDNENVQWLELQFNPANGEGDFVTTEGLEIVGEHFHTTDLGESKRTWRLQAVLED